MASDDELIGHMIQACVTKCYFNCGAHSEAILYKNREREAARTINPSRCPAKSNCGIIESKLRFLSNITKAFAEFQEVDFHGRRSSSI